MEPVTSTFMLSVEYATVSIHFLCNSQMHFQKTAVNFSKWSSYQLSTVFSQEFSYLVWHMISLECCEKVYLSRTKTCSNLPCKPINSFLKYTLGFSSYSYNCFFVVTLTFPSAFLILSARKDIWEKSCRQGLMQMSNWVCNRRVVSPQSVGCELSWLTIPSDLFYFGDMYIHVTVCNATMCFCC